MGGYKVQKWDFCTHRSAIPADELRIGMPRYDWPISADMERIFSRFPIVEWVSLGSSIRRTRAGFPATIVFGATFLVTTEPAPTIAFSPITTFDRIVAPEPIEAPFLTKIRSTCQSFSVCRPPLGLVARG